MSLAPKPILMGFLSQGAFGSAGGGAGSGAVKLRRLTKEQRELVRELHVQRAAVLFGCLPELIKKQRELATKIQQFKDDWRRVHAALRQQIEALEDTTLPVAIPIRRNEDTFSLPVASPIAEEGGASSCVYAEYALQYTADDADYKRVMGVPVAERASEFDRIKQAALQLVDGHD